MGFIAFPGTTILNLSIDVGPDLYDWILQHDRDSSL